MVIKEVHGTIALSMIRIIRILGGLLVIIPTMIITLERVSIIQIIIITTIIMVGIINL